MEAKGIRIRVLSGSFPDSFLTYPKDKFIEVTLPLHNNDKKKLKVLADLWENANNPIPKQSRKKEGKK